MWQWPGPGAQGVEGAEAGGVRAHLVSLLSLVGRHTAAPGGGGSVQDTPAQRCPGEAAGSQGWVGDAQRDFSGCDECLLLQGHMDEDVQAALLQIIRMRQGLVC